MNCNVDYLYVFLANELSVTSYPELVEGNYS